MKAQYICLSLFAIVALSCCGSGSTKKSESKTVAQSNAATGATRTEVEVIKLNNFFVKNNVNLPENVNLLSANDSATFYNTFGMARTMNNAIIKPDFAKNTLVAIVCKATNEATTIDVQRIVAYPSEFVIYVHIVKGEKQSYTSTPMQLLALPKLKKGTVIKIVEGEFAVASGTL